MSLAKGRKETINYSSGLSLNKIIKSAGLLWALTMLAVPLLGQSTTENDTVLSLSLEEALERANENGYNLRIAKQDGEVAKATLGQSNAAFLPQFSIEETAIKTNDPVGVFGVMLRQGIITANDFNPAILNDPDPIHNFTTRFELVQPIINADALLKRSAAKFQLNSVASKYEATVQFTKLEVKDLYFQLAVLDEQIEVQEAHLKASKAFKKQAEDYLNQGIINKAEYLNASLNTLNAEQELIKAKNARSSVNDKFLLVLGIEEEVKIQVLDGLKSGVFSNYASVSFEEPNSTLKALQFQLKANDQMLKVARFSFFPKLNVFGSYELHDKNIFGNQGTHYLIGASLRWDVFKGFKQVGMVAQRKAEQRKSELLYEQNLSQHKVNIRDTKREIETASFQVKLTDKAVEQSEEDVRIRDNRYKQGLEKTSDLLLAEAKNQQNKLNRLRALYQYHISVARLEYLLETEL